AHARKILTFFSAFVHSVTRSRADDTFAKKLVHLPNLAGISPSPAGRASPSLRGAGRPDLYPAGRQGNLSARCEGGRRGDPRRPGRAFLQRADDARSLGTDGRGSRVEGF